MGAHHRLFFGPHWEASTLVGLGLLLTVEGNPEDFTFLHLGLSLGLFAATLLLFGLAVPVGCVNPAG
jgi:hypothetical protein